MEARKARVKGLDEFDKCIWHQRHFRRAAIPTVRTTNETPAMTHSEPVKQVVIDPALLREDQLAGRIGRRTAQPAGIREEALNAHESTREDDHEVGVARVGEATDEAEADVEDGVSVDDPDETMPRRFLDHDAPEGYRVHTSDDMSTVERESRLAGQREIDIILLHYVDQLCGGGNNSEGRISQFCRGYG